MRNTRSIHNKHPEINICNTNFLTLFIISVISTYAVWCKKKSLLSDSDVINN